MNISFEIGDCVELMSNLPNNVIDLVITSPPYDNLRDYGGYTFNFESTVNELYRIVKDGGAVVWIINDQVKNGSESGTSFKQALYFLNNGWKLHDTMIYKKINPVPNAGKRYQQCFEYMFIFSKGKIKTTNIQLRERRNKCNDKRTHRKKILQGIKTVHF